MLLEFSVENYRSIRDQMVLSLVADEGKKDPAVPLIPGPGKRQVLPVAMVYGANASGKSNLLRAFQALRLMVYESGENKPNEALQAFDPFRFHPHTPQAPTRFELGFMAETVRYRYEVAVRAAMVFHEALFFYPQGREAKLFEREAQHFSFGDLFKGPKATLAELTAPNQLFLSKAAQNNAQVILPVYRYFLEKLMPIPFLDDGHKNTYLPQTNTEYYTERIIQYLAEEARESAFSKNFLSILKSFDTGFLGFRIKKLDDRFGQAFQVLVSHEVYDDQGKRVGTTEQPLEEESAGTQKLFVLAALVLRSLMQGRVLIVDEFERSLHPHISQFLVKLFQDPQLNPHHAQLVLATHDTHLLNHPDLRRDQIWLIEKDRQGASQLFSLADVQGLRADIPFEKWYLSGRFGAVPGIQSLDFELNLAHEEA